MIFSSAVFIFAFLPITVLVYFLLKPLPIIWRNCWLFLASLVFYAYGEPRFVFILLLSICMNYLFGLLVDKFRSTGKVKIIIAIMILSNLSLLFVFKYLNFSISIFNKVLGGVIPQTSIVLPIGISFFTFQAISYVLDVYRGKGKVQKNPLNVGLYIALFPQLVAGPIVRYETIADQIYFRKENVSGFSQGIERFIVGFCKKILLADNLSVVADAAFLSAKQMETVGTSFAWLGAICYSLQIYYDFSGYSDMAIGLGKMFGFSFEENFRLPYISASFSEFWRRWHISLGSWFRDYLYIPLGGSRVGKKRLILNLFIVWSLTGLWHGAGWTFILWGLMYFVFLLFEKLTGLPGRLKHGWARLGYRIVTLAGIVVGWVIFRAETLGTAYRVVLSMFLPWTNGLQDERTLFYVREVGVFLLFALLIATPLPQIISKWVYSKPVLSKMMNVLKPVMYILLFLAGLSYVILSFYSPFIYFNF